MSRVLVRAAVTQTIGGIRIDERARVLDADGEPLDGLFAAGVDAGGWATGGYASGLSAALVFGRIAAEIGRSPRRPADRRSGGRRRGAAKARCA